ncbi:hypothetical protein D3C86_1551380 [compost metagenome]
MGFFCCNVEQCHVKSTFNGAVVCCIAQQVVHPFGDVERIFTDQDLCKVLRHGQAGFLCFSYNHWKSRAFPYAIDAGVCIYPDQHILCKMHGPCSNYKGFHRDAETVNFGMGNLHCSIALL